MDEYISIDFAANIKPVRPINEEFTLCECYILALGKNRKKLNITKDAVDDAMPTLFNIPVVGHLFTDKNGRHIGAHDKATMKNESGKYEIKTLTVPFGVVPEQENVRFEEVEESNGNTNTYLVADVILWTGYFPEIKEAIYSSDIYFGQSMEIKVKALSALSDAKEDKGYFNIDKFSYSALCLLGKSDEDKYNFEPCFEEAKVKPYKFALNDESMILMEEFKDKLSKIGSYLSFSKQGGTEKMRMTDEIRDSILAKHEMTLADFAATIQDDITEEAFEQIVVSAKEIKMSNQDEQATSAQSAPTAEMLSETNSFSLTYNGKYEALSAVVRALSQYDETTSKQLTSYWLIDYDDKYAIFQYVDYRDDQFKSEFGRVPYIEGADGQYSIDITAVEKLYYELITKNEIEQIKKDREELFALREFKADTELKAREEAFTHVLAEFSDLASVDEFSDVLKNMLEYSDVDALRKECFAIRGKNTAVINKPKPSANRIPIAFSCDDAVNEVYGGLHKKYLGKAE